jgi:hypothetical protein
MEEKVGMDTFEMNWREICEQEVSRKHSSITSLYTTHNSD